MPAGVYLKGCCCDLKKDIAMLSLSPFHFRKLGKDKTPENGPGILDISDSHVRESMLCRNNSVDGSTQDEIVSALFHEPLSKEDEGVDTDNRKGLRLLVETWLLAQLDSVASHLGMKVNTLVLLNETLLHFKVKGYKSGDHRKRVKSCNGSLDSRSRELQADIFYILTISEESLTSQKANAYELSFDVTNDCEFQSVGRLLAKLNFGDPVYLCSVKERRTSASGINSKVSSLSWMGATALDVLKSRYFLGNLYTIYVFSQCTTLYDVFSTS